MKIIRFITKNIYSIIYVVVLLLLLVDSYGSDDTIGKFLHLTSRNIAVYSILALAVIRILYNKNLITFVFRINTFLVFPISTLVCIALTIYEYNTYPNAAFALVKIQYSQLCLVSIFSLLVILFQQTNDWYRKYYQYVIFTGAFAMFGYAYLSSFSPFDFFANLSKEDFFIEKTQVFVLLTAVFFSLEVSRVLYKKHRLHAVVFILISVILFFIAGEEISWGQRIFHLATPEIILQNNTQNEITIHNLSTFSSLVGFVYIVIGFYGAFAWLTQLVIPKLRKAQFTFYIPAWFCMGYYLFGFLYNYYDKVNIYNPYSVWSEFAELMLYCGIMFTLLNLRIRLKHAKAKNRL